MLHSGVLKTITSNSDLVSIDTSLDRDNQWRSGAWLAVKLNRDVEVANIFRDEVNVVCSILVVDKGVWEFLSVWSLEDDIKVSRSCLRGIELDCSWNTGLDVVTNSVSTDPDLGSIRWCWLLNLGEEWSSWCLSSIKSNVDHILSRGVRGVGYSYSSVTVIININITFGWSFNIEVKCSLSSVRIDSEPVGFVGPTLLKSLSRHNNLFSVRVSHNINLETTSGYIFSCKQDSDLIRSLERWVILAVKDTLTTLVTFDLSVILGVGRFDKHLNFSVTGSLSVNLECSRLASHKSSRLQTRSMSLTLACISVREAFDIHGCSRAHLVISKNHDLVTSFMIRSELNIKLAVT